MFCYAREMEELGVGKKVNVGHFVFHVENFTFILVLISLLHIFFSLELD